MSIDYYRKVLSIEKRNKQALSELELSRTIQGYLDSATLAFENKQYHKVSIFFFFFEDGCSSFINRQLYY